APACWILRVDDERDDSLPGSAIVHTVDDDMRPLWKPFVTKPRIQPPHTIEVAADLRAFGVNAATTILAGTAMCTPLCSRFLQFGDGVHLAAQRAIAAGTTGSLQHRFSCLSIRLGHGEHIYMRSAWLVGH